MVVNNNDYNVVKQPYINKYIKVNLLNQNFAVVDEISGQLINLSISVNADSDLRRMADISLIIEEGDDSYIIKAGSKIFLNRYCQPYVGYENITTGEIQWYNQGIYLINAPSWEYNAANNTLSFNGIDLMSKLTGMRNGNLEGVPAVIPQGSNVRNAIIETLALGGFTQYIVDECTLSNGTVQDVPYDIEIPQGGTVYQILEALRDIVPNYQMYFDIDGVFHYDRIPSGDNDPVLIDDDLWKDVLIGENVSTDFENMKNVIEVFGKTHDGVQYYDPHGYLAPGGLLKINCDGLPDDISPYTLIGATIDEDIDQPSILVMVNDRINALVVDSHGNPCTHIDGNRYVVFMFQEDGNWQYLGGIQPYAKIEDDNPDSPFYVEGEAGRVRIVLSGGEYDNIGSDELALERAKAELYWRCRLNDTVNLVTVPIPWLDVNIIVEHTMHQTKETRKYMIKTYNVSYGEIGNMSITAISYYSKE